MSMRIEYGKIHKIFDEDVQEFTKGILEDRFNELQNKQDRTEEENKEFNALIDKYNGETNDYINKRAMDEVEVNDYSLSTDEYAEIMETNAEKDVTINNQTLNAPDFLEALHNLFVKD
jgi:ABC-type dipeptide/oligopeptide/nickel transport system ATPase component